MKTFFFALATFTSTVLGQDITQFPPTLDVLEVSHNTVTLLLTAGSKPIYNGFDVVAININSGQSHVITFLPEGSECDRYALRAGQSVRLVMGTAQPDSCRLGPDTLYCGTQYEFAVRPIRREIGTNSLVASTLPCQ
jgi:hypothetical protein